MGEQAGPRGLPGPAGRQVREDPPGRGRHALRDADPDLAARSRWRSVALARSVPLRVAAARVRSNAIDGAAPGQAQPARELPGRQVRQGGSPPFRSAMACSTIACPRCAFSACDGVQVGGVGGGEHRVEAPGGRTRRPARRPSASRRSGPGTRRTTRRPAHHAPGLGLASSPERGERRPRRPTALLIRCPEASSKMASVYSMGSTRLVDGGDRGLDLGVHANGDRHIGPAAARHRPSCARSRPSLPRSNGFTCVLACRVLPRSSARRRRSSFAPRG